MPERDPRDDVLDDSPSEVDEFLRDAVTMEAVEDPDLGDVTVEPGGVVGVVDGDEVRHDVDESGLILPVEDEAGEIIGKNSFPEVAQGMDPAGSGEGEGG